VGYRADTMRKTMEPTSIETVVLDADDFRYLIDAAQSTLGFWDNALDDEEWRAVQ